MQCGLSFEIADKLLTGFNFTQGLMAKIYTYTDDKLLTICGSNGCSSCQTEYLRYNSEIQGKACYCPFGSLQNNSIYLSITMPFCFEPALLTACGVTIFNSLQVASALAAEFNITAFANSISQSTLSDILDAFFLAKSEYDSNSGFTEVGLSSVLLWMRGIPITMPETIINIGSRALEEPAANTWIFARSVRHIFWSAHTGQWF